MILGDWSSDVCSSDLTSLAFALAYTEMFTLAKQVAATNASIMPLFVAGVFYYIFNFLVAWIMEQIEKSMQYYR